MRRRNKQLNHKMFCHFPCHVHLHLMIIDSQLTSNLQKPLRGGSLILEEQFNINRIFCYSMIISENETYRIVGLFYGKCHDIYLYEKEDCISSEF